MKFIGTILGEDYPVEGKSYMAARLACGKAYIDTHKLGTKKTNIIGLVSLRRDKRDKGVVLLKEIQVGLGLGKKRGVPPVTIPGGKE